MGYNISSPRWLQNAIWFIKLRWIALFIALISVFCGHLFLNIQLPFQRLYLLTGTLATSNIIYYITIRYIRKKNEFQMNRMRIFLNLQVLFDLLFLTAFLHFSGGIENPAIVFYIFHMILSGILLPRIDSLLQATFAQFLFVLMVLLEYKKILPHYTLNENLSGLFKSDVGYLTVAMCIFTITSYLVVLLTSYVTRQLREHELDLEKLNHELNEKDRIKNEYVLRLTHDIKGYLTSVKSSLDVINLRVFGEINKEYVPFIEGANHVLLKLSTFIKDLLHLTKTKLSGNAEKDKVPILNLIQDSIQSVENQMQEKNISVKLEIDGQQSELEVITLSVKEMLINLIGNALKYSPKNTEIKIVSKPFNQHYTCIMIGDSGIGIPQNEIPLLFKEFFRASNAKSTFEGSGLGLSIVKQIALNHGGNAWIESEESKGTNAFVTLPYSKS